MPGGHVTSVNQENVIFSQFCKLGIPILRKTIRQSKFNAIIRTLSWATQRQGRGVAATGDC